MGTRWNSILDGEANQWPDESTNCDQPCLLELWGLQTSDVIAVALADMEKAWDEPSWILLASLRISPYTTVYNGLNARAFYHVGREHTCAVRAGPPSPGFTTDSQEATKLLASLLERAS